MTWRWEFSARARRDLRRIPVNDVDSIVARLNDAAINPGQADLQNLAGSDSEWRLRLGRWRAIIELDNDTGMMTILRVLPRDRAYR